MRLGKIGPVRREMLAHFEKSRERNRQVAEAEGETSKKVNLDLLEFDKHSQTPNDAYAIRIRLAILLKFVAKEFGLTYEASVLEERD
jgi:hypothetical protein